MDADDVPLRLARLEARWNRASAVAARILYVAVVAILVFRPAVLFPVSGPYCGFCFRHAVSKVSYRNAETGQTFTVTVCADHARTAPKRAPAGTLGFVKTIAWIAMAASTAFVFFVIGRTLFFAPLAGSGEFGAGCALTVLLPMLAAELLHIAGWHLTGRVAGWVAVFLMFAAAMAMTIPIGAPASSGTAQRNTSRARS